LVLTKQNAEPQLADASGAWTAAMVAASASARRREDDEDICTSRESQITRAT
jgi:MYXO-CTERM domain-containing protein